MHKTKPIFLFFLMITCISYAQLDEEKIDPRILNQTWEGQWITHPQASLVAFGVFYFRNTFDLSQKPDEFIVHVSADNRYELYVNGEFVCLGPAWGDLLHWRFESVDIASHLKAGKNVVAARVVNFGSHRAVSQFSYKTGFLMQGNGEPENVVNTNLENWKVTKSEAYRPISIDWRVFPYYYATFSCDTFEVSKHVHRWRDLDFDDSEWLRPSPMGYNRKGTPRGGGHLFSDQSGWLLVPRNIPLLTSELQRFATIERAENIKVSEGLLKGEEALVIPAHSEISILLDQEVHTRAYPELVFSGGKGSTIKIEYAEALVDEERKKGNRNVTSGKHTLGYYDVVLPDGGTSRRYRPLWVRVFRYVELQIKTADEPLTLQDIYSWYTAYPYQKKAEFESDQPALKNIVDISWRTLRNATAEVFEDGPYYEQLMYAGDARIASLVSLYLSGDERMTKNAIELFDQSRMPEGLTYSRYPSNQVQINPQYSLAWIQMIYDYFRHGSDSVYASKFLRGIVGVLQWHEDLVDSTGMLGEVPFLRHIEAKSGTPKHPERGHSAQQTLFFALTLNYAAEIFDFYGQKEQAQHYRRLSAKLKEATYQLCYDPEKELFADTPMKQVYTQHANVLAILNDMLSPEQNKSLMKKILQDESLLPSFLFFKFYVFQALDKAGMGDQFIEQLDPWLELLDYGLTTFPEFDVESRSDCHPWSTHPAYFLYAMVAGIQPMAPGFNQVKIAPQLGLLRNLKVTMPHHQGEILLQIDQKEKATNVEVNLPSDLKGEFIWQDKIYKLHGGLQTFNFDQ